MTKETMTVHKALAELKTIDKRIEKAISDGFFCEIKKHSAEKVSGMTEDELNKRIQSNYDKVKDLIDRRSALKKAVVQSNSVTKVKIGDSEYTVAIAIEMKNHGVDLLEAFLRKMESNYSVCKAKIESENGESLEKQADSFVTGLYGNKDGKVNATEIEKLKEDYIKSNQFELIDPINISEKISETEAWIADFSSEVDAALSVSNALTEITIEY